MRRYGIWEGNPKGTKENLNNCIVEVMDGKLLIGYQCRRKRGWGKNGLFCKQHAKMIELGISLYIPKDE